MRDDADRQASDLDGEERPSVGAPADQLVRVVFGTVFGSPPATGIRTRSSFQPRPGRRSTRRPGKRASADEPVAVDDLRAAFRPRFPGGRSARVALLVPARRQHAPAVGERTTRALICSSRPRSTASPAPGRDEDTCSRRPAHQDPLPSGERSRRCPRRGARPASRRSCAGRRASASSGAVARLHEAEPSCRRRRGRSDRSRRARRGRAPSSRPGARPRTLRRPWRCSRSTRPSGAMS